MTTTTNHDIDGALKPHRQIDGNVVKFWALKREAVSAAKAMGWRAKDVGQVWTRFQVGYAIYDNDGDWMTKARYATLTGPLEDPTR